jgi:hypothetical protein
MSLGGDVDLEEFVTTKDDLSGADIKAVCTEAGLLALRERRMRVTKADFTTARERVSASTLCLPAVADVRRGRCWTGKRRACPKVCISNQLYMLRFVLSVRFFHPLHSLSGERMNASRLNDDLSQQESEPTRPAGPGRLKDCQRGSGMWRNPFASLPAVVVSHRLAHLLASGVRVWIPHNITH